MSNYREPERVSQLEDRVRALEQIAEGDSEKSRRLRAGPEPSRLERTVEAISRWRHNWRPSGTFFYQLASALTLFGMWLGWDVEPRTLATVALFLQAGLASLWAFRKAFVEAS